MQTMKMRRCVELSHDYSVDFAVGFVVFVVGISACNTQKCHYITNQLVRGKVLSVCSIIFGIECSHLPAADVISIVVHHC